MPGPSYNFSEEEVLDAIERSNGTYTSVAKCLGGCNKSTAFRNIKRWESTAQAYKEKQKYLVDTAECVLFENLMSDNQKIAQRAAEFCLEKMPASHWRLKEGETNETKLIELLHRMVDNTDPSK